MASEFELNARRSKIEQVLAAQARDAARLAQLEQLRDQRAAKTPEALEILGRFRDSGVVERLKKVTRGVRGWPRLGIDKPCSTLERLELLP